MADEDLVVLKESAFEQLRELVNRDKGRPSVAAPAIRPSRDPLYNLADDVFWVRITGEADDGGFEWAEVSVDDQGAFAELDDGRVSQNLAPAYEANGIIVEDGTYVVVHQFAGPVFLFAAPIPVGQYVGMLNGTVAQYTSGVAFPKLHGWLG